MTAVDPGWIRPEPGWVCAECGFDFDACEPTTTPEIIGKLGSRYRIPLSRGLADEDLDALLRTRPATGGWSALEYACHMRDVFRLNIFRIERVVAEDRPSFEAADREKVAIDRDYNGQDPAIGRRRARRRRQCLVGTAELALGRRMATYRPPRGFRDDDRVDGAQRRPRGHPPSPRRRPRPPLRPRPIAQVVPARP